MNTERIKTDMLTRIAALGLSVTQSDSDMLDYTALRAASRVQSLCGLDLSAQSEDTVSALISAAADIAAADAAAIILSRGDGAVSSRTDGDVSVRYADGTSGGERVAAEISRMRELGVAAAVRRRRFVW